MLPRQREQFGRSQRRRPLVRGDNMHPFREGHTHVAHARFPIAQIRRRHLNQHISAACLQSLQRAFPTRYPWMLCQRAPLCRKFQYHGNIQSVSAVNKAMTRISYTNERYIYSKLLLQISMLVCKQLGESLPDNSKTHQRQAKMFHICFFLPKTLTLLEFLRYTLLTN